jgi:hypothetical protein
MKRKKRVTVDLDQVVQEVARFYLDSHDFNACPATSVLGSAASTQARAAIETLVTSEKIEILTEKLTVNPHIKRLPLPSIEQQLAALKKSRTLQHVCLYPHKEVLRTLVDATRHEGKPFELDLALGAPQLMPLNFDLTVLEFYRNDPRYHYECDDMHGWISISDDFYRSPDVPKRDQILLDTFGFAYNEKLDRAVVTFLRYLANLSPEHQQVWKAKQLGAEFKMHPDFYRSQIVGDWPENLPIFTAFWMELGLINEMTTAMGRPPLFRDIAKRPRNFAFLIRPTLGEFNDFVLVLDKIISDNLNKKFFQGDVDLEDEAPRADGKIVVRQKGTLALLDEWMRSKFRTPDWEPFDEAMGTFREIRKLRQNPAHALESDAFDQKYFHKQHALIVKAYNAVRVLRMMFEKHPAAESIVVDVHLRDGKISDR